jgi:hypothetical protein
MLESCVNSWDPTSVYKDKCKRFVSMIVKWSEMKVLLKMVCYTCGLTTLETRYCSFSLLCCFLYRHFVLICTVVVLYCFVVCVCARARACVCVCVYMSGFCNVCVCEGFVMCGCFWWCVYCTLTEVFFTLTEVFPCFFLSCKANASVKLARRGTDRTLLH